MKVINDDDLIGVSFRLCFLERGCIQSNSVCCSPNGEVLVSGSDDGTISLLHVASGRLLSQIQCQQFGQVFCQAHKILSQIDCSHQSHAIAGQETSVFSRWFYFSLCAL